MDLADLLECSICLDQLDEYNKVLPCQHTFCHKCLQDVVRKKKELLCPECRAPVTVDINFLPPNILVNRILESMKQTKIPPTPPSVLVPPAGSEAAAAAAASVKKVAASGSRVKGDTKVEVSIAPSLYQNLPSQPLLQEVISPLPQPPSSSSRRRPHVPPGGGALPSRSGADAPTVPAPAASLASSSSRISRVSITSPTPLDTGFLATPHSAAFSEPLPALSSSSLAVLSLVENPLAALAHPSGCFATTTPATTISGAACSLPPTALSSSSLTTVSSSKAGPRASPTSSTTPPASTVFGQQPLPAPAAPPAAALAALPLSRAHPPLAAMLRKLDIGAANNTPATTGTTGTLPLAAPQSSNTLAIISSSTGQPSYGPLGGCGGVQRPPPPPPGVGQPPAAAEGAASSSALNGSPVHLPISGNLRTNPFVDLMESPWGPGRPLHLFPFFQEDATSLLRPDDGVFPALPPAVAGAAAASAAAAPTTQPEAAPEVPERPPPGLQPRSTTTTTKEWQLSPRAILQPPPPPSAAVPRPPSAQLHRAAFDYSATKPDELSLVKGDLYMVTDRCQDGWFRGMHIKSGKFGVFPGNYVIIHNSQQQQQPADSEVPKVVARMDLIAHGVQLNPAYKTASQGSEINLIDLSEESDTEEEEEGENEEGESIYTSAESEAERREKLRKIREALRQSHAQNIARSKSTASGQLKSKGDRYRCVVSFPASTEFELDLQEGDIISLVKKRQDGWCKGILHRTGKTGLFPASFVERV